MFNRRFSGYLNRVAELVKEAALLPELCYISWNITVREQNEIYLVEGNATPDTYARQAPEQAGNWTQHRPLIEKQAKFLNR